MRLSRRRGIYLIILGILTVVLTTAAFAQGATAQTISFIPVSDQVFGVAPFQVVALASSNLPVTLAVAGPAFLNGRLLTITGVGTVTITADQAGNSVYAPASAQLSFAVKPAIPILQWNPETIIYGTPLDSTVLNATAMATPAVDPAADTTTITWQLNTSQITDESNVTVPASSSLFRYEGAPMVTSPYPNDAQGLIPDPTLVANQTYRIAFTCNCQEFEFAIQTRTSFYRLWVDGAWQTADSIAQVNDYPKRAYYRVQFPDKRVRQIKIGLVYGPPFFGLVTHPDDTISPPQSPLGPRTIIFGDSWTAPTIVEPLLPPTQPGVLFGSGLHRLLESISTGIGGKAGREALASSIRALASHLFNGHKPIFVAMTQIQ